MNNQNEISKYVVLNNFHIKFKFAKLFLLPKTCAESCTVSAQRNGKEDISFTLKY